MLTPRKPCSASAFQSSVVCPPVRVFSVKYSWPKLPAMSPTASRNILCSEVSVKSTRPLRAGVLFLTYGDPMPVSMAQLCDDLMAETAVLEQMVEPLDADGWLTPTPAEGWSVLDQVGHLAFFDEAATLAATDPDRFRFEREVAFADPAGITETAAARYRALAGEEVLKEFRAARAAMLDV